MAVDVSVDAIRTGRQRRGWRLTLGLACLSVLSGCQPRCPEGQTRQPYAQLFFGGSVPDQAWMIFAGTELTSAFPDGFTMFDAAGQWRDPASGQTVREHTRVVQVSGATVPARLAGVGAAYRKRFHQISVGVLTGSACAAF